MTTELDIYALKRQKPIDANRYLVGLSMAELRALALKLGVRVRWKAEKDDLVHALLAVTHPVTPAASAATDVEQQRLF